MKLKGSLTTPTCGRFYGKKLNLVVLSQLVGFFNSLIKGSWGVMPLELIIVSRFIGYDYIAVQ